MACLDSVFRITSQQIKSSLHLKFNFILNQVSSVTLIWSRLIISLFTLGGRGG